MTSPIYPPRVEYKLSAIRAALNVGLIVRLTLDEMNEVVHHLQRFDMFDGGVEGARANDVIRAFRLERLAIMWDSRAGDFRWLLVPDDKRVPQGELGGAAVVVLRWGSLGNVLYEPAGTFSPSQVFLHEMAQDCQTRASEAGLTCGTGGLADFSDSTQN